MNVNKVVYNGNTLVDLTSDTVAADNLASGVTAHAANGTPIVGLLPKVEIDSVLSSISTNPVQNKVINSALANKMSVDAITTGFALMGATSSIQWRQGSQAAGSINATNYTGTSAKAAADGSGNTISTTYAKLASENTWSALQTFNSFKAMRETYIIDHALSTVMGTYTPTASLSTFLAGGNITIDLSEIYNSLSTGEAVVLTIIILNQSGNSYALSFNGVTSICAVGNADDIAISESGTLLNIACVRTNELDFALLQGAALSLG